jgi:hypothetical protein
VRAAVIESKVFGIPKSVLPVIPAAVVLLGIAGFLMRLEGVRQLIMPGKDNTE